MATNPEEFFLVWFSDRNDDCIRGRLKLSVTREEVCKWFKLENDPYLIHRAVLASQLRYLEKITEHQIDLNKYDYYVVACSNWDYKTKDSQHEQSTTY